MPEFRFERDMPFTAEHLFDIAADVEHYPEFVPWWRDARIRNRKGSAYATDQILAFGAFRQRVSTQTHLERPRRIVVSSTDRPFRQLSLTWTFQPLGEKACRVCLHVDLSFRSRLAERIYRIVIGKSLGRIIDAFEQRAKATVAPQS